MVIKILEENVIEQIRSCATVNSFTQCATELVLNSLDAKSTAIAVRVNLATFKIQVVDNGKGISRSNLELIGERYMTNKCHSLSDLKNRIKYYGFKGEALASISQISQRVTVMVRERNCNETYCKVMERMGNNVEQVKSRPSFGVTVTVEGFLSSLPVRQQCIKSTELENMKRSLESLVIIHPRVSFSLRNDLNGALILDSIKCVDIPASFKTIHPEIDEQNFAFLKISKSKTSVEGLIHRARSENKRLQYIYVNKRPISCPQVQNLFNASFRKFRNERNPIKKNPIFVVHIRCPYSDIDLNLEPAKTMVFFKKIDVVKRCLQKMIKTFLSSDNIETVPESLRRGVTQSGFGISQIGGAVKGLGVKRKSGDQQVIVNKVPKLTYTPLLENHSFEAQNVADESIVEQDTNITPRCKKTLPIELERNSRKSFNDINENSLYTNFPDNEKKGKNIIMDMFIKSVEVFPSQSENAESLYQKSSVTIPCTELAVPTDKVTMGVQTSLDTIAKKMISVGVQTGPSLNVSPSNETQDYTIVPRKSLQKYVSDYNFDFSKVDALPTFQFTKPFKRDFTFVNNFNQTVKLFDFPNAHSKNLSSLPKNAPSCISFYHSTVYNYGALGKQWEFPPPGVKDTRNILEGKKQVELEALSSSPSLTQCETFTLIPEYKTPMEEFHPKTKAYEQKSKSQYLTKYSHSQKYEPETDFGFPRVNPQRRTRLQKKEVEKNIVPTIAPEIYQKSPYFSRKQKLSKNVLSLKRSKSCSESTSLNGNITLEDETTHPKGTNLWETHLDIATENLQMTISKNLRTNLDESNISKYFTPQKCEIHSSKKYITSGRLISIDASFDYSKDLFTCTKQQEHSPESDDIVITINEGDRQKILDRDLLYEKKLQQNFKPTLTLPETHCTKRYTLSLVDKNDVEDVHKAAIANNPLNNLNKDLSFGVTERLECVPKGLSPIFKVFGKVEALSPKSKENLQNAVIESFEDELLIVKWRAYDSSKNPKEFFKEIYKEKSKQIETSIPNIGRSAYAKQARIFENMSFTKDIFKNSTVIGQVDLKFIAVVDKTKNLILLFDQHAVHERIRLEQLSEGYKNAFVEIDKQITMFMPQHNLDLFKKQRTKLTSLGLKFDTFHDGIIVHHVPLCIYNKSKKGANLVEMVESLVKEVLNLIKNNGGILVNTPKVIQDIINSEACRGAIKFGDYLNRTQCILHLNELNNCLLPFQCAHGRPTISPLLFLKQSEDIKLFKPRLINLK